jgi:hypothetical protein
MGRTPHSIYYHLHLMARVGLLREVGQRREGGGRSEALYRPARATVMLDSTEPGAGSAIQRTMAAAFRMAERDLKSALESAGGRRLANPGLFTRLHFRATPGVLKEVRSHLQAAMEVVQREARRGAGRKQGALYSLTLALLPLRGRNQPEEDA